MRRQRLAAIVQQLCITSFGDDRRGLVVQWVHVFSDSRGLRYLVIKLLRKLIVQAMSEWHSRLTLEGDCQLTARVVSSARF